MLRRSFRLLILLPKVAPCPFPAFSPGRIATVEEGVRFDETWKMSFFEKKKTTSTLSPDDAEVGTEQLQHLEEAKSLISPWHNIPLVVPRISNRRRLQGTTDSKASSDQQQEEEAADGSDDAAIHISPKTHFYYVNEIPKGTREKIECSPKKENNPLVQDRNKDGSLRKFTFGKMPFHYGFFPRTFENPEEVDKRTGKLGDGDPIDVVLLSAKNLGVGEICEARVVGAFAMIDQGETDWKILAVPVDSLWKDTNDVPEAILMGVHYWFRMYKTTDGKPENKFAFDGKPLDAYFAVDVVADTARQYLDVACGKTKLKKGKPIWVPS